MKLIGRIIMRGEKPGLFIPSQPMNGVYNVYGHQHSARIEMAYAGSNNTPPDELKAMSLDELAGRLSTAGLTAAEYQEAFGKVATSR